jgi:hypothetical protein
VLHASSSRVAVGVHDPALGWVEIDTHAAAGQVSAALIAASSQSHASLTAQLGSLAQYLAEHEVRVAHLGVAQQGGDSGGAFSQHARQDATADGGASSGGQSGAPLGSGAGESGREAQAASLPISAPLVSGAGSFASSSLPFGGFAGSEAAPLSYISVHA